MSRTEALHVAFVVEHAYIDALACFREPIKAFAAQGAFVDVYTRLTATHPAPVFTEPRVRLIPLDVSYAGAAQLVARLVGHRPRYSVVFAPPQWSLYCAAWAGVLSGTPVACISDELIVDEELSTPSQHRWKSRERWAHRRCALTIALSQERADLLRTVNRLPPDHPIHIVPNSGPGPAGRRRSHFYQDVLGLSADRCILLHAGGMGWRPAEALASAAATWQSSGPAVVFQGRLPAQVRSREARGAVSYSPVSLPADMLDYAVSSAHIGLGLYDGAKTNDRLMGTASGKLCLYLKNALPVITTRLECFEWVEREGCGVRVGQVEEIPAAAQTIGADYDRYAANARGYFDRHLDFTRTFQPVMDAVERLAGRRATVA